MKILFFRLPEISVMIEKYVQVNMSTSRSLKSETIINEYREVNDNK